MTFRQTLQLCKPVREIPTVISLDLQYNGKQASKQARKQVTRIKKFTKKGSRLEEKTPKSLS